MTAGLIVWVVGLGLGAAGVASLATLVTQRRSMAAWRHFAETRGARLGGDARAPWMELEVGQALVRIDLPLDEREVRRQTRIRARFVLGAGPRFRVLSTGPLAGVDAALGRQDVVLGGDDEFDARFVVRTDDAPATAACWSPMARNLRKALPTVTVSSDGETVRLERGGVIGDVHELDVAMRLVGELAQYRVGLLTGFTLLPGARPVPPSGDFATRPLPSVELPGRGVRLGPQRHGLVSVSAAWLPLGREAARDRDLSLVVEAGGAIASRTTVPAEAAAHARRTGPCTVRIEEAALVLRWRELVTDPDALLAGARLLETLVASGPAYR